MRFNYKRIFLWLALAISACLVLAFFYFFVGGAKQAEKITWGVDFSQRQAQELGLDWQELYSAILDDLGAKKIKIAVHWDLIEPEEGQYSFDALDWQIQKAREKEAKIILMLGMKTSRWPECHIPDWAKNSDKKWQQDKILKMLEAIVLRYGDEDCVLAWQVENEPLFPFGECPWSDKDFLRKEVNLVKTLDPKKRQVLLSDSGELSSWFNVAKIGDVVGITMYRKAWFDKFGRYFSYPFPPVFYRRKAEVINKIFKKDVICIELQAEPWGPVPLRDLTPEEQKKTMDSEKFKENISFAKKTGLEEFYFWGAEWWYWMKTTQNQPQIWDEAKVLFIK